MTRFQSVYKCTVRSLQNTKQVLKAVQKQHQGRLEHELASQGFIVSSIIKFASTKVTSL